MTSSVEKSRPPLIGGGALDPQGPVADEIAGLWWVMLVIGVIVYLAVMAALLYAVFRRRDGRTRSPGGEASLNPGPWIIVGGVVMPSIVLGVIFALTLSAMRSMTPAPSGEPVVVDVVGHQWWWEIHYEGHDFATANEIHIPIGEAVELRLTSADVIHSFWVPGLGGKIDALPDYPNTLVLQADEPGEYRGQCAEFCGLQHAKMGMIVVAQPRGDFEAWLAGQAGPSAGPGDPLTQRGQEVFLEAGCPQCHTVRGTRASGDTGPDLTHIASRQTLAAATIPNTPEHLGNWISDPQSVKEGTQMETPQLSDDDLDALTAYLMSLR